MSKKKTKDQKRKARIRKAKAWVATFQGTDILQSYCNRFGIEATCAAKDLEVMKAATEEQRAELKQAHDVRVQKEREERAARLLCKLEKRKIAFDGSPDNPSTMQKALKDAKPAVRKPNPNAAANDVDEP